MMHDHDDPSGDHESRRQRWRAAREARRAAWRARREARRARWTHGWGAWGDPKMWGLDPASMGLNTRLNTGLNTGMNAAFGMGESAEVAALRAKVADMEKLVASLSQRVIVLERLATDGDSRLAAEIEKLRDTHEGAN